MGKIIWKPGTLEAPVPPALVTCGTLEKPNVLTVAWTGIVCTHPAMTYVSVRPSRYSYELIRQTGEFVINLTTADLVRAADFCGVRSGRDMDKFSLTGLTPVAAQEVSAPVLEESPIGLECRVKQVLPLGSHDMFLAEIVAVDVDESCVDRSGKLRLDRCGLVGFEHGAYYELGRQLGTFGFSVNKKNTGNKTKSVSQTKKRKQQAGKHSVSK